MTCFNDIDTVGIICIVEMYPAVCSLPLGIFSGLATSSPLAPWIQIDNFFSAEGQKDTA